MLNVKDLATLKAQLEIPLAVHDILSGVERMSDATCYALHNAISEMKPHDALMCIALSTRTLVAYCDPALTLTRTLKSECDFILEQYAGLYASPGPHDNFIRTTMANVTEDLHSLHQRLKSLGDYLGPKNALACIFCDILGTQAHAQKMIAEEFAELFEMAVPTKANNVHFLFQQNMRTQSFAL